MSAKESQTLTSAALYIRTCCFDLAAHARRSKEGGGSLIHGPGSYNIYTREGLAGY